MALVAIIAGLASGLLAAIPGAVDYFLIVPPQSTAKSRASKHALINISMLLVFSVALALKKSDFSLIIILLVELMGVILIGIAGWMGGTLIIRNQIGVDHRYAHAGKWKEEIIRTSERKIELKNMDDLKVDQMKLLHVNRQRIVIARTETGIIAFQDRCTHRGASLADGVLICGTVQCPWHGSQFDLSSGEVKAGPAKEKIRTYQVMKENEKCFLFLQEV